jgi:hypothetical protein
LQRFAGFRLKACGELALPVEVGGNQVTSGRALQQKLFNHTGNLTSASAFQPENKERGQGG